MVTTQINVRLTQTQLDAIDRKRIALQPAMGKIPSRSDVLRYALDSYLANAGHDAHGANGTAKRQPKAGK